MEVGAGHGLVIALGHSCENELCWLAEPGHSCLTGFPAIRIETQSCRHFAKNHRLCASSRSLILPHGTLMDSCDLPSCQWMLRGHLFGQTRAALEANARHLDSYRTPCDARDVIINVLWTRSTCLTRNRLQGLPLSLSCLANRRYIDSMSKLGRSKDMPVSDKFEWQGQDGKAAVFLPAYELSRIS